MRKQIGEAQRFSGVRYEDEEESRAREAAAAAAAAPSHPAAPAPAPAAVDARAGFAEIIRQKKEAEARRAAQTEAAKLSNKHKRGPSNAHISATTAADDDGIPPPPPPLPESNTPPAALTYSSSTSRPASKRAAVSAATFVEPEPADPPPPPPPPATEVSDEAKLNSLKLARRMFASLDSTSFELEELLPPSATVKLSNIEKKKKDLNTRQELCSVLKELCVRRSSKTKHREAVFAAAPRREQAAVDAAAASSPASAPAAVPAEDDPRSDDDDDDASMVMVCWDANDPMSEPRVRLRAGTAHVTQESITATPLLLLDPDADPEMVAAANAAAAMAAGEAMMQRDLLRPVAQRRRSSTPSPPPPPPPVDEAVAPVPAAIAVAAPAAATVAPVTPPFQSPSGMPGLSAKAHALLNGKSLRQQRPLQLLGMLRTNIGYRFLLLHCYREYSEENILCFKALEAFKRHPTAHTLLSIHEKYIKAGSELMINISSRARQIITEFVNAWKVADNAKKEAMQAKRRTKEGTWNAQNFQSALASADAATKRALPVAVLPHTPTTATASPAVCAPVSPTSELLSQLPFVLDRAHSEILALLERDSFARFLKTPLFQAYLLGASPPLIMKRGQAVDEAEDLELLASVSGMPAIARTRSPHEGGVSPAHKHSDPDFRSLLRGKSKGKRPTGIDTASKYTGISGPNGEMLSAAGAATPNSSPPHTPRDPMCIMDRVRNAFRSSPQPPSPSPLTPRSGGGNRGRLSPGPAVGATPVHFVSIGPVASATSATTTAGGARKTTAPPPTRTPPPRPSSSSGNNLTPPLQRSAAASVASEVHFVFHPPAPPADTTSKVLPVPQGKPRPQALLPMLRTLVGYRFLLAWLYSRREEVPLLAWKAAEIFRQFASTKALRSFYTHFLQTAAAHPVPLEVVTSEQRDRVAICLHELESSLPPSRDLPDVLLEIQSSLLSHLACCHAMFKATPLWASYVQGAGPPMELRRVCDEIASSASSVRSIPLAPLVETPSQRHSRVELIEDVLAESMMLSEHLSPQALSPISTPRDNATAASMVAATS